jgi:hypothetical protein
MAEILAHASDIGRSQAAKAVRGAARSALAAGPGTCMTNAVRDWKTPELAHRRAGLPTHRWDRTASNWTPADSLHGSLSDWQDRRDSVRERHLSSGMHFLTVRIAAPSVADENETSFASDLVIPAHAYTTVLASFVLMDLLAESALSKAVFETALGRGCARAGQPALRTRDLQPRISHLSFPAPLC